MIIVGGDMFCENHLDEALEYIKEKYPEYEVGYSETIRNEVYDTDETMRCGYPDCMKESKYIIDWVKVEEFRKRIHGQSISYKPLD